MHAAFSRITDPETRSKARCPQHVSSQKSGNWNNWNHWNLLELAAFLTLDVAHFWASTLNLWRKFDTERSQATQYGTARLLYPHPNTLFRLLYHRYFPCFTFQIQIKSGLGGDSTKSTKKILRSELNFEIININYTLRLHVYTPKTSPKTCLTCHRSQRFGENESK